MPQAGDGIAPRGLIVDPDNTQQLNRWVRWVALWSAVLEKFPARNPALAAGYGTMSNFQLVGSDADYASRGGERYCFGPALLFLLRQFVARAFTLAKVLLPRLVTSALIEISETHEPDKTYLSTSTN